MKKVEQLLVVCFGKWFLVLFFWVGGWGLTGSTFFLVWVISHPKTLVGVPERLPMICDFLSGIWPG